MAAEGGTREQSRVLLGWVIGMAIGLTLLHGLGYLAIGSGPLLAPIPWFVPTMHTFVVLASICVAFLAFGRYRVLYEPATFWLGIGFVVFIVFSIFYVVSWPDLLPNNPELVARGQNIVAWFYHLAFSALAVFLLVSLEARWPRPDSPAWLGWPGLVVWCGVFATSIGLLSITRADLLPALAVAGAFTPLNHLWNALTVLAFALVVVLAARRYLDTGDSLFGHVAITALALGFAVLTSILSGRYYGLWWYWQRVLWVIGLSTMLFGLLSEYVLLFRRQVEKSRELEAARAEVVAERNRLRVIVDAAPFGIILYNASDAKATLTNHSAEVILGRPVVLGLSQAESIGYYRILHPDGGAFAPEELPSSCALRGETCSSIQILVEQSSGRRVHVLANAAPLLGARGDVTGAIVGLQDITPLREQALLREEFLSAAAHELRTPVTIIKGYVQIMGKWVAEAAGAGEREKRVVTVIDAQCDRLNRRVQELLDVVQIQSAGPGPRRNRFDLRDVVNQVIAETVALAPAARILVVRSDEAPVEASRESIAEVIGTLLDNAVLHSPPEAEVTVNVSRDGEQAIVEVRDQGPGVARERQPHIFEPFYETVPAGEPGYHGVVGLGLYLGRLAVERHRGHLWLESEPGAGAAFFLSLPLAD